MYLFILFYFLTLQRNTTILDLTEKYSRKPKDYYNIVVRNPNYVITAYITIGN